MDPNEIAGLMAGATNDATRIQGDAGKQQSDRDRVTRLYADLQKIVEDNARDIAEVSKRHRSRFDSKLNELRGAVQEINSPK